MPANLTAQYLAAEEKYKNAKDDRERMKALKDMLAHIPKHKGTEKLQADIKRKIARLKDEVEIKKSKGGHRFSYSVEREGAGQVAVVGPPNVGKSQLISALTATQLEVADYPFTTRMFHPAMMPFEDIQIQLIDLPPLSEEYLEHWAPSIIRVADMMLLVMDAGRDDILDQFELTLRILHEYKIQSTAPSPTETIDPYWSYLNSLVVLNKIDALRAGENFQIFDDLYRDQYRILPASATRPATLESIRTGIVKSLQIIRVYSKRPGHDAEMNRPFTFRQGSTLMDFANAVHKDFAQHLKFARVWGAQVFEGQRINKDYILQDKDVIELHV
ncbi:MAG: GTPase [Candidatus Zhuqueibacterota bacterium]